METYELELRLELEAGELGGTPCLRRLALERIGDLEASVPEACSHVGELRVPSLSQRELGGELSERGCSPTSLAMVLRYHGVEISPEVVADRVFDRGAKIFGNWSLNVALAGELGLDATVRQFTSLRALEQEVAEGRPVVVSHRFEEGELPESPLERTDGHLLVVSGFTEVGDVIVRDPAASPQRGESVRRVYPRGPFERSWLDRGLGGVCYVIRPS